MCTPWHTNMHPSPPSIAQELPPPLRFELWDGSTRIRSLAQTKPADSTACWRSKCCQWVHFLVAMSWASTANSSCHLHNRAPDPQVPRD